MGTHAAYELILDTFRAQENAHEILHTFSATQTLGSLEYDWETWPVITDPGYALVQSEERIIGYVVFESDLDDLDEHGDLTLEQVAHPIPSNKRLSEDGTLLQAISLMSDRYDAVFIGPADAPTHVLHFLTMDDLPLRIALFSATAQLELSIKNYFRTGEEGGSFEVFSLLPLDRQKSAKSLFKWKYEQSFDEQIQDLEKDPLSKFFPREYPYYTILDSCISLRDWVLLLVQSTYLRNGNLGNRDELQLVLNEAIRVRNRVAHNLDALDILWDPVRLTSFFSQLHDISEILSKRTAEIEFEED